MANYSFDFYNHASVAPGANFATAASGTTTAGTVSPIAAGAGAGSSTSLTAGTSQNDTRGQFNLITAGSPAAGAVAQVLFTQPYASVPGAVVVNVLDTTASPAAPILAAPVSISQTGFNIQTGALTAAHTYAINYEVVA